jgi:hypothetical protein
MSFVLLLAAAYVIGGCVFRQDRFRADAETFTFRFLAGLIACAVIIVTIGSYSLPLAQLVIDLIAFFGLGKEFLWDSEPEVSESSENGGSIWPRLSFFEWGCVVAAFVGLGFALISALAPVTAWDATVAHVALPKDYVREGRICLLEGNEYSVYPQLLHCLYAYAYSQGGALGVTLLSWSFAALTCLAIYLLGNRLAGRRCGLASSAILATAPVFLDQGGTASVDLPFCAYSTAALVCLFAWRAESRRAWLILAACFAGSSCGIRHTGYIVCVFLFLATPFVARERRMQAAVLFGLIALVFAGPWLARSALLTGNPIYPFFDAILGRGRIVHWNVTGLATHSSASDIQWRRLLMFPWDIIMKPQMFDGWAKSPGAFVLLLGVPGLFVGGRKARALGAFSGAGVLIFFFFERLARYLLPFFIPMMAVGALAESKLKPIRHLVACVMFLLFAHGLALDAAATHFKIPVVFHLQEAEDYFKERVERYAAFQWVNGHVPYDETIFTFDRRTYFFHGKTYQNDEPLKRIASGPISEVYRWFVDNDIHWVFVPVSYIEESAGLRSAYSELISKFRMNRNCFLPAYGGNIPRPHGVGTEWVEVYEVRFDGDR